MMAPDLIDVIARVQEQLGEQLDLIDREGGEYVRRYAESALRAPTLTGPMPPIGMHPHIRKMIRELTLDELHVRRYNNAARSTV